MCRSKTTGRKWKSSSPEKNKKMDKTAIRQISAAMRGIHPVKFTSYVDDYVKTSAITDASVKNRVKTGFLGKIRILSGSRDYYPRIEQEASVILSQFAVSLKHIRNFQFKMNGQHKGIPDTDQKTRLYFKRIKQQQTELLLGISEEVEIVRNMIRQAGEMRGIIQNHSKKLQEAAFLMDIVGERLSQQSIPVIHKPETGHDAQSARRIPQLRPENGQDERMPAIWNEGMIPLEIKDNDKSVRQIAGTLQDIKAFEDTWVVASGQDSEEHRLGKWPLSHYDIIGDSYNEIKQRKQRIITGIRELRQGWKFLKKLATKGYSHRMQRGLDALLSKHDNRMHEFQKYVQECRAEEFPEY